MFRTRLISGILLVIAALAVIMTGGVLLAAVLGAISVIAYRELTKACGMWPEGKPGILEIAGCIMTVLYYVATAVSLQRWEAAIHVTVVFGVVITFLVFLFVYVFTFPKYHADQVMTAVFSFLYAPVMLSFIYLLRAGLAEGRYLVWLVFLCSWGSDTCAYAVGVLIGRHKMTPKLSPKKSVEGAVGGVVGAALLCMLYTQLVINVYTSETFSLVQAALLGAVGAMVSMVGDLAASAIKRDHDIKDYGKLIPGHGGIMDRFDSVIVTAPIIFMGTVLFF